MPALHLVDRPDALDHRLASRQGIGAMISGASHAAVALLLVITFQLARKPVAIDEARRFDVSTPIWMPNLVDGGGRSGGGDRSGPARAAESRGADAVTVQNTQPSRDITNDMPIDLPLIEARPMVHGTEMLPGPIVSDQAAASLGRGDAATGGDGPGRSPGIGNGSSPRGFGDGAVPGGPGVTTPVVIQQVKPQYTADAMRAKMQGSVWLECVVLPDGTVGDVRVTRSLDQRFGLDQEAIAAARRWRFKPGLMNGQPVPVLITIELTFTLR